MNQNNKIIQLKLKTPLWTGNINKRSEILRESGLLGSIRWWFRAMLRSKGIYCVKDRKSKFENNLYEKKIKETPEFYLDLDGFEKRCEAQLKALSCHCPDCLIFGTTGWKHYLGIRAIEEYTDINNENNFFQKPIKLEFIPTRMYDGEKYFDIIVYIISLIAKYGAIGAKIQKGYGVFEIFNQDELTENIENGKKLFEQVVAIAQKFNSGKPDNKNSGPNVSDMFFYKIELKKENLKYYFNNTTDDDFKVFYELDSDLKNYLRNKAGIKAKEIFGDKDYAGKINISGIYQISKDIWEMRVWGYFGEKCSFTHKKLLIYLLQKFSKDVSDIDMHFLEFKFD